MRQIEDGVFSRVYHRVVNYNQWFNYGRTWALLPFTLLQISSYISILLIFFGLEENTTLLAILSGGFILGILGLGYVFFIRGAEQVDKAMLLWRNTPHMISVVAYWYQTTGLAINQDIPVPDEINQFGVKKWDDLYTVYEYMLEKGREAGADPICRKLLKGETEKLL